MKNKMNDKIECYFQFRKVRKNKRKRKKILQKKLYLLNVQKSFFMVYQKMYNKTRQKKSRKNESEKNNKIKFQQLNNRIVG